MLVSIIIPCYNVDQYITTCLKSAINQTYQNIEIICIDDGSTDKTKLKIQDFILKHPDNHITYIHQDNRGASAARNNGIRNAKGDYLQFLDADDQILKEKIDNQINLASINKYPDLIVGSYRKEDESGNLILEKKYKNKTNSNWLDLIEANLGNTCSNLFKSDKLKKKIIWNENLKSSQESALMFDLLKDNAKVVFSSDIHTLIIGRTTGSISASNKKENWKRYITLRKEIIDFIIKNQIDIDLNKCYQIIFGAIRSLYPYDAKQAIKYFKEYIPKNFKPEVTPATTKNYLIIFKLLGFEKTEKIKSLIK